MVVVGIRKAAVSFYGSKSIESCVRTARIDLDSLDDKPSEKQATVCLQCAKKAAFVEKLGDPCTLTDHAHYWEALETRKQNVI